MNIRYITKKYLQHESEFEFYKHLAKVVTPDIIVLPQVHLERVIHIQCDPHNAHGEKYLFHGISELSFDFVLFNKSFEPLLAIELDGTSHNAIHRRDRDMFVEEVCKEALLPLVRIERSEHYDLNELKEKLINHLPHAVQ